MSNGHACCILGICCPPDKQGAALAAKLHEWAKTGGSPAAARQLLAVFDLSPKGTTKAVLDAWAAPPVARAGLIGEKVVDLYAAPMAETASDS
jgi:hypothetical protein